MRQTAFGQTGRPVSVIGQGTWHLDEAHRPDAVAALRRGLDLGMSHIDTAEMYGEAELVVAEAIEGRRDEVFLVSKVLPNHASARSVVTACERSLARLKTDRLDSYLLHWRGGTPLEETIGAFEGLIRQGKLLSWGVSNFDVSDLDDALAVAGEGRIACNQVLYHLGERAIEHAVLPWCEAHGVALVAYSPFGHDDFPGPDSAGGRVLGEIAAETGATQRQVALAALTQSPSLLAIPKASRIAHVEENAAAGDLILTENHRQRLDAAFPRGRKPKHLPML